jgi:hypothetical protein
MAREERMRESVVRKFTGALNRLWDVLESLESAAESLRDLADVDPIGYRTDYERIRENLEKIWDAGDRISRAVERMK